MGCSEAAAPRQKIKSLISTSVIFTGLPHPQARHHPCAELTVSDSGRHSQEEIATSEILLAASLEILILSSSAFLKSGILPRDAEVIERGTEYGLADFPSSVCQRVFLFS